MVKSFYERRQYRPRSLSEALEIRSGGGTTPFAGGTDLMVRHRGYKGTGHRIPGDLLFLDAVPELCDIRVEIGADPAGAIAGGAADGVSAGAAAGPEASSASRDLLVIGASVPLSEILAHSSCPDVLRRALELHASPAIRNRATLGGNIANASPAADSVPPLMVLDARLRLYSVSGSRELALADFATGPGTTVLREDELIGEILIPLAGVEKQQVYYRKAGTRKANALSRVSLAGLGRTDSGGVPTDFRFAFGAVARRVIRIPELEQAVVSGAGRADARRIADPFIRPIDDQRSTAEYRKTVALNGLEEFLNNIGVSE